MTLYLTFSALDSGRLSLGDALPVSMNALNAPPTKMGMNGTVLVRDAVMGLVTRSANDAAVLLAEGLGGDEDSFARLMTQKARQLGMASTVFRNASGLPDPEQVTTARDMARLANALLRDFPHYYPVFSVLSYNYRGRTLANHNRMLATYAGADGLKTGYTNASGFNLVMSAMRDNRRLIGVVMGGNSAFQRDRLMAELMDRGFMTAQATSVSAWTSPRVPPSARYSAANFVQGIGSPDVVRVNAVAKAEPAPQSPSAPPPAAPFRFGTAPGGVPAPAAAPQGGWVIQVGSFGDSRTAQARPRARQRRPSRSHPLAWRGDRRRGAACPEDRAPGPADQPFPGRSHRRLQAAQPAQDLLLGDPGHCLESNALSAGLTRARNARLCRRCHDVSSHEPLVG